MGFDPVLLKKLIDTFKAELQEQLQVITDGLLQLEKSSLEKTKQTQCIETIFRAAHNIKGASRSLGINDVGDIAHHIESIFSSMQKNMHTITPIQVDLCFEAIDKMRLAMQSFIENQPISFDLASLLTRLEKGEPEKKVPQKKKVKKTGSKKAITTLVSVDNSDSADKPRNVGGRVMNSPPPLMSSEKKQEDTTVVQESTLAKTDTIDQETIRVSVENLDRISALMEEMQVNKIAIDEHHEELTKLAENTKQLTQLWQASPLRPMDIFAHVEKRKSHLNLENNENLKKFYITSNDHLQKINHTIHQLQKNMRLRINDFSNLSHILQEEVRMLRLIPAASLLQSLPRAVRDLAQEMNKKVELIITGDDVKMDKMVLEKLKNPIIHLLRNAIDHGIEEPSLRKAHGKTEMGHIWLQVVEEGNHILLRIKDDGAGINSKSIAELSEKKQLITASELTSMSEADILELIFRPGFSTKEIITQVSGRGVGLNVVKENMTDLKGHVSMTTKVGEGTTFDLHFPLTLASERGLIVRSGGQLFVIPSVSIERVLMLQTNTIIEIGASQAILLNSHPVPLRTLADILNLEKREPLLSDQLPLIIIKKDRHTLALIVESIEGEREIVVKPLQPPIDNLQGIAGGTLAGSGQVMIVLNPGDILSMTLHAGSSTRVTLQHDKTKSHIKPLILIVDDSITTRTLEKSILESNGYQVTIAVDGKEAWDILQKQPFSLLITDVMMPNVDGFTLTDRVKKAKNLQHMPVIIVTSLGSETEKKRGIEVGADAYIVKNEFESGILLDIVKQLV